VQGSLPKATQSGVPFQRQPDRLDLGLFIAFNRYGVITAELTYAGLTFTMVNNYRTTVLTLFTNIIKC
jgi:hypothetical protein